MVLKYRILNVCGLYCPESIIYIRKFFCNNKNFKVFCIISDDTASIYEIPNFCFFMNFNLLFSFTNKKPYKFFVKK